MALRMLHKMHFDGLGGEPGLLGHGTKYENLINHLKQTCVFLHSH